MKTILNKEQSRHLYGLGCVFPNNVAIQDNDRDFYIRITFTDLLDIIPKDLLFDDTDEDSYMEFGMIYDPILGEWNVYYTCSQDKYRGVNIVKTDKELIDALYHLACWHYEKI